MKAKFKLLIISSLMTFSFAWFGLMVWQPDQTPEISSQEFIQKLQNQEFESVEVSWNTIYGYASTEDPDSDEKRVFKTQKSKSILRTLQTKNIRLHKKKFCLACLD